MRRGSKIALLSFGGSAFVLLSAATAFLVGHGVGTGERLATNKSVRQREQAALASMNMTKTAFQAWSLVCRPWPGNERRCVLFIAAADPDRKQVLLTFSVARTPQGMPVLIVDTPPGIAVDQGVSVTAGSAEGIKLPVQSCGPQRCRAITELTLSLRAALEKADITAVSYVKADNQQSTYNLPTRGFKDALTAWYAGSELPKQPVSAAVN
jgi:invasion protein IalB